ncbi:MAG: lipopolysaccharide biosynthesis protein [Leeuwenhoekiella sp.]
MSQLRNSVLSGVFFTAVSKYSNIVLSIVLTAILSRLLTPGEFGIVAIALVFINFFQLLSNFGLGPAIVQNKNLTDSDVHTLFGLTFLLGIVAAILFFFSAYFISAYYEEPELLSILKLLSLSVFFYTLTTVPQALNLKKQIFKKLAFLNITVQLISGTVAVTLAYRGFGYYALVIKAIIDSILLLIGNLVLTPTPISFRAQKSSIEKVFRFSSYQFLFNIINYFTRNADNLLIGKYFGVAPLGFYDKSYRLMLMPVQSLTQVITPVLHPVLSNYQEDKERIYQAYKKVVLVLATIGFPLAVLLFFSSRELVLIIYGDQWKTSIPVFEILALSVGLQMVLSSSGAIFQAIDRTDLLFRAGWIGAILILSGICYGVFFQKTLISVAHGILTAFAFNFIQCFYLLIIRGLDKSFSDFLKLFIYPMICSLLMAVCLLLFNEIYKDQTLILSLIFKIVVFMVVFTAVNYSIRQNRKILLDFLKKKDSSL